MKIILYFIIMIIKTIIFYGIIDYKMPLFRIIIINIPFLCFLYGIGFLIKNQHRKKYLYIVHGVISLLLFCDAIYYQYYYRLPSVFDLFQIGQVSTVWRTVENIVDLRILILIADYILFALYKLIKKSNKNLAEMIKNVSCKLDMVGNYKIEKKMVIFTKMIILIAVILINIMCFKIVDNNSKFGIYTYHIKDIYNYMFVKDKSSYSKNLDEIILDFSKKKNLDTKHFGIIKNKNIIVIQVESLQNFTLNSFYNKQEITPNLNKLMKKDTIYFDHYYQMLGRGNTSDAEFVSHNSMYPSMEKPTYTQYKRNTFFTLPIALKEKGYITCAFHGYKPSFWGREGIYKQQGLDTFISEPNYVVNDKIGFGLSDKSFFKQSTQYIKNLKSPFYAFLVTLSSHNPFEVPKQYQTLSLKPEHESTMFGNYIKSIHYVDSAVGEFIDELKKEGLYDNSAIIIYGDHYAMDTKNLENSKFMSEFLGKNYNFQDMMNIPLIIHIPNSNLKEKYHIVGSELDLFPTMLNLLGIENNRGTLFGQDLINTKKGFVAQQTYMLKGSFIDDEKVFEMSRDGVFEHSKAWNIKTGEPISIEKCKEGYNRAIDQINESNYILKKNLLKNLFPNVARGK